MSNKRPTTAESSPLKMQKPSTVLTSDQFRGPYGRSCPGMPPKERKWAFDRPLDELTQSQREAAELLFQNQDWEEVMPRRSYGVNIRYVLAFQKKTWGQLNKQEQKAATLLDMSERFWNNHLTPFHDDLWAIPDVTLTPKEFAPVLATIKKMARSSVLTKKALAHFLLSLERLLLPSQGAAMAEALKASPSWESLLESARTSTDQHTSRFHVHLVIASFLSDPVRFVDVPYIQINAVLWDDDSGGCIWGNAGGTPRNRNNKTSYGQALAELIARRNVDPILAGAVVRARTRAGTPLPPLPKQVVKYLLDEVLGIPSAGPIDPFTVSWLYGYDATLTLFFAPEAAPSSTGENGAEETKE